MSSTKQGSKRVLPEREYSSQKHLTVSISDDIISLEIETQKEETKMSNYETITADQLTNRAHNVYFDGIADAITEPTYAIIANNWNTFETTDENAAIAKLASFRKMGADAKIILIVPQVQPVVEEVEATPETSEVVEQSVEASTASSVAVVASRPAAAKTYMTYNKLAGRYEAESNGKLFYVSEDAFADRLYAACKESSDDEYRIWSVLTWLSSWDFSGKQAGASVVEVAHA